jgi:sulfite reductase (NADPH) flavoprotein alpha-component
MNINFLVQKMEIRKQKIAMTGKIKKNNIQKDELLILYGSRTGNSRLVAKQTELFYRKNGVSASCVNMAKYNPERLSNVNKLLAVVSTHGKGVPPEQAQKFFLKLMGNGITNLTQLNYSVCALGDSAYKHFCKAGKDLDEHLNRIGAKPVLPRIDCDVEFSKDAVRWIRESYNVFYSTNGNPSTEGISDYIEEIKNQPQFSATITSKKKLTQKSAQMPVYHISMNVESDGFSYEAGDSIEIFSKNPEWLADKILEQVQYFSRKFHPGSVSELTHFLLEEAEITRLNAGTIKRYQKVAKNAQLKQLLRNKPAFTEYLGQANLLDLIIDFPCQLTAEQFIRIPAKLTPRVYSIASGPQQNPGTIDLVVKTIRYQFKNLPHEGAGSVFITEDLQPGNSVGFSLEKTPEFRLPEDPRIPVVMIGVGTGIAPFRAFLQERSAMEAQNGTWLIWGAKKQADDSLYKTELENFMRDKILERVDTAFSRDNKPKKYVQDVLAENKKEVVKWLKNGAHIYVCGSIAMGEGVKNCLNKILKNTAFESVKNLQRDNRYHTDVY